MDVPKVKNYENKEWLATELSSKSVRQISKEERVSYKLINAWGITHDLIVKTADVVLA